MLWNGRLRGLCDSRCVVAVAVFVVCSSICDAAVVAAADSLSHSWLARQPWQREVEVPSGSRVKIVVDRNTIRDGVQW